ncbi:MAG: SUMF1/EgtB/PvdO family nonheme iron enzyme [Chloroflexota bacterium]
MPDLTGHELGRYHLLEKLGEGGMAVVYKAYDTRLETDVAVKVITTEALPQNAVERALKRFEREAKALARLTHPNIVKVTDYGEYEGKPYLVMPYLPGGTLKAKLGKPMPWQEAVELILPVAEALAYAHSQHTIHRDVKPSNIILTQSGRPMLTDFGIAKLLDLEDTVDLTGTSAAVGTPEYMAPEQAKAKTVDHRVDIYALGIVLYEMVTGRKPFVADTPMAVLIMQATEPLPPPRKFAPSLPDRAEKILLKALAKKPDDRYQTMDELYAALKGVGQIANLTPAAEKPRPRREQTATIAEPPALEPTASLSMPQARPRSNQAWLGWGIGGVLLALICLAAGGAALYRALFPPSTSTPEPTTIPVLTTIPTLTQLPFTQLPLTEPPTQPPTATTAVLGVGSIWTRPADGMTMMFVPEGSFEMGSDNGDSDEKPVHTVYLDSYWMDMTEVTNAMYALCVSDGDCDPPQNTSSYTHSSYYGNSQYDDYPVIYVDWNQADAYCQWAGAGLPTEAEWEKAARGTDGRTYPWGEGIDCNKANYNGSCVGDTSAVGSYESGKSPYGIYDLAGNVWEWVADWYDSSYYSSSPSSNPLGPSSGQYRALRGGTWSINDDNVRSAGRNRVNPTNAYSVVGFRCSRSP